MCGGWTGVAFVVVVVVVGTVLLTVYMWMWGDGDVILPDYHGLRGYLYLCLCLRLYHCLDGCIDMFPDIALDHHRSLLIVLVLVLILIIGASSTWSNCPTLTRYPPIVLLVLIFDRAGDRKIGFRFAVVFCPVSVYVGVVLGVVRMMRIRVMLVECRRCTFERWCRWGDLFNRARTNGFLTRPISKYE
jgi:hypothetical protein